MATVTITIDCPIGAGVRARDDEVFVSAPGVAIQSILANDSFAGEVTLTASTPIPPALSLSPEGQVELLAGAALGVYYFSYEICVGSVCSTAEVTVNYVEELPCINPQLALFSPCSLPDAPGELQ